MNEAQREAVAAPVGAHLVLAGAGSGKTRVLTHRIAYLVQGHQVSALSILAVTFTNKASREMRGRIEELLEMPFGGLWIGTFHGLCHRLLRMHYEEAGLFRFWDAGELAEIVKKAGFRNVRSERAFGSPPQAVVVSAERA